MHAQNFARCSFAIRSITRRSLAEGYLSAICGQLGVCSHPPPCPSPARGEGTPNQNAERIVRFHLAAFVALFLPTLAGTAPAAGQAAQLPERPEQHQHPMDMNVPSGVTDKCG